MENTTIVTIAGRVVDILNRRIYAARVELQDGYIWQVNPFDSEDETDLPFILPGFVDAHVHIESSMLVPAQFARMAVVHGTVATVSDPHEIANVCGLAGVEFMIENGKTTPFKFSFGAPSCVPATTFETAGAALNSSEVASLLQRSEIRYLSEMMNFPGVLFGDEEVMQKIAAAKALGKPIDGHAPGLRGNDAQRYIDAGISTDHECFTYDEALDKLQRGMKIIIREGSAAKNFEALVPLLHEWYTHMMFCSDDKHPDSLAISHINELCARAVGAGVDVFKVLQAACINPVLHYGLDVGLLQPGQPADFILLNDLVDFKVLQTWIGGHIVAEQGKSLIEVPDAGQADSINRFACSLKQPADFFYRWNGQETIPVIEALDGQLITNRLNLVPLVKDQHVMANTESDMLKIAVVNRYFEAPVAVAFIKNFGLKGGAIASSVAHDSHNIVAVGADDESLCRAVNLVILAQGGVSAVLDEEERLLPLPVAGLMSPGDGYAIAEEYAAIDRFSKYELRSTLLSPFMTLSFMALLVIPHLKLSDKGLFDGDSFSFLAEK